MHDKNLTHDIIQVNIEDELKQSYLDYAMSVIVGRALPEIRDGLKPVHRRVLYAMHELNNDWNKPYKKSARIVGDVIGKYHPHGDTAVYDTTVRLAQPFSLRYPLVDGQGNFGSIDGDSPAAMRYTEIRLSKISHTMLSDLDKETVDFVPNYDGSEHAPSVLPARIPNLLINGTTGIAVGMTTNIPPHNLSEVINACIALIDDPLTTIDTLIKHIPGPDFPTAGIINGRKGIIDAYKTGRGKIFLRAKTNIEEIAKDKEAIIITELPYQVNKARIIEKIAELVRDKHLEGISTLRDESDKDGMRIFIELKRGENAQIILNNLYSNTQLQQSYSINMIALVDNQPRILNLLEILNAFLQHRKDIVTRRCVYQLNKAKEQAHLLEGLGIALNNIDEIIQIIKSSVNPKIAKEKLTNKVWKSDIVQNMLKNCDTNSIRITTTEIYGFTEQGYQLSSKQAQAILDLRLHRLTALEQEKILTDYKSIIENIFELLSILNSPDKLLNIIRKELLDIKDEFGDNRLTEIQESSLDLSTEYLIDPEEIVITLSHEGYIKQQSLSQYQAQKRGGKGKSITKVKEEDFIEKLIVTNSLDTLLCFSSIGKLYWLKAYQIPQASRIAKGKPIINLLPLATNLNEKITAILPIKIFNENQFIFMATEQGSVKKIALSSFAKPRSSGVIAISLVETDRLIGVDITNGNQDIMLFTDAGKVNRFHENLVRTMGRSAKGVRGIKLKAEQKVTDLIIVKDGGSILTATENGFGKRTPIEEYRLTSRGGQGVISIQVTDRNGKVVHSVQVYPHDEILLLSSQGTLVRTPVDAISLIGRNTQGVKLIQLENDEKLVGLQNIGNIGEDNISLVQPITI